MARSINKVTLIGNLGKDPEVRQTPNGGMVANFSIACSESWKDKNTGEKKEKTEWVNIVVWGPQAGIVQQYLRKGSKIYLEGKLQTRQWEDKNGGGKRYTTEVVCQEFMMLDGKEGNQGGGDYSYNSGSGEGLPTPPADMTPGNDDLPF